MGLMFPVENSQFSFKFSSYLFYDLGAIKSSWADREDMLLSAAAHEDILSEKWAVWSGVGVDGPTVAIKNPMAGADKVAPNTKCLIVCKQVFKYFKNNSSALHIFIKRRCLCV